MTTAVTDAVLPYEDVVAVAAFDPGLGLDVHVALDPATEMLRGYATRFGGEPNSRCWTGSPPWRRRRAEAAPC
jgi:hypothetical protein